MDQQEAFRFFMGGSLTMAMLTAAWFFLSYRKRTKDTFFSLFALAFTLMGLERLVMLLAKIQSEEQSLIYLMRLAAFVLIIAAILLKNAPGRRDS